ncbi:alpha-1,4-glucan--maltose-1-phosphate maltosyltransferase [Nitrococcus mobilis]|uniref:Alpha-1,4-glucan:maltose-1-phosphate maltosyltransferase n=1 Tax=Nitrococcus mobilis Nb-231 TaxID=314278 RepID=A4BM96_9GAMM|nr:alpha-1,4-glucan--maltose-1-phosphate maltosyltransferase [Nitrococcus mobilis]EAR23434.1 Alpha amylase, catalytic region [Nitrococcus mobilis Nb-231]
MAASSQSDGRKRVVIEGVAPAVDAGRFPIKRTLGEKVVVEADAFVDGHDQLACVLCYRKAATETWTEVAMRPLGNDRWSGEFAVDELGRYGYTVTAWVDHFRTWCAELKKRTKAEDIASALMIGAELIEAAAARANEPPDAAELHRYAKALRTAGDPLTRRSQALDPALAQLMAQSPDRMFATTYERELMVVVDVAHARFSTWYELFPRSCVQEPGTHGSLRSCAERLPYIAAMGFDVLYLPPIHPIGTTARKGRNNTLNASAEDPGSPWAIGSEAGGHKAVHPQLGTLEDFRHLVRRAREQGLEVALDIAFQCSPDHPYVKQAPQWFRWRPDGTVQYAENPPKKYQDIYPFNFESEDWQGLWDELEDVFLFWIEQGVRIFRVDNPHTKPFPFWEWLITHVKAQHPEVIFLAEAFTRPKVMHRLAKLGFTQSYTYFTWRNNKWELMEYFTELTQTPSREYFRPNLWPNTPDILNEYLQVGGRPAFMTRLVLAATLGANYGIYGPAFELCEARPREPGSEEYLDSEKYEIRAWELERPDSLAHFITRVNQIRRENPALQQDWSLRFHPVDNEALVCYSKHCDALDNVILVVVNVDPHHTQAGWVELPLEALQLLPEHPYQVHDLLSDARYLWQGARNYVELDPHSAPAHIFRVRRHVRTEHDFDYFM